MGTSAYGLAQMAVLAERTIPKLKPKIVFVQHSPWLANRARCIFYPSAFGIMPFPYIYTKDEQYEIAKPLFSSSLEFIRIIVELCGILGFGSVSYSKIV
jgi:hypothetical protein